MAQWQELLRLNPELQSSVSRLYESRFPRNIRHCLCSCIEAQDWEAAAIDENKATAYLQVLLKHLEDQWSQALRENNILQTHDFLGMRDFLLEHYQNEPVELAMLLSACLKDEKKILALANATKGITSPGTQQKWMELENNIADLKWKASELKRNVKMLENLIETLDFIQKTWQSKVEQNTELAQSKAVVEQECLKQSNNISERKQFLLQQLLHVLNQAAQAQVTLLDVELPEWKRRQQLACIGCCTDTSLELLQKWFTSLCEVLLGVCDLLRKLQDLVSKYDSNETSNLTAALPGIQTFTLTLLTKLLENALVVEKQPFIQHLPHRPLILKTGVRFSLTVRFLANLPDFKFLLKVKPIFCRPMISDDEQGIIRNGIRLFDFTRDDSKILDVDSPGGGLVAEFSHMSLKEKKTRYKGPCESYMVVTEELHIIKFESVLHHAGQTYNINTTSLPVVVITSSNQVTSAWASVMWCNMTCTSESLNLALFIDPPPLSWQQLAQMLSWQFLSVGRRGLDEEQLSMLRERLVDDTNDVVHWNKFSKDESAWVWIDAILDLIKKHLLDMWRDGHIMGFVSRKRTKFLLQSKPNGTFLIRFSESVKDGAVTFSWVDNSMGEVHVHAVEPYTRKELSLLTLTDAINHYSLTAGGKTSNPLIFLYPDIPKEQVFRLQSKEQEIPSPTIAKTEYLRRKIAVLSDKPTPPPSPSDEMEVNGDYTNDPGTELPTDLLDILDSFLPPCHEQDIVPLLTQFDVHDDLNLIYGI